MFLACTRKQNFLVTVFVLVDYLCVLFVIFKAKCNRVFWSGCFGIATFVTFVTLATIQVLMSPLLNVSALNSTQCLCLGLTA